MNTYEVMKEVKSCVENKISQLDYECLQAIERMIQTEKSLRPEELYY